MKIVVVGDCGVVGSKVVPNCVSKATKQLHVPRVRSKHGHRRGALEVGGPEQFHLDELVRRALAAFTDPREVITDPHARWYGIKVRESTLIPGDNARLRETVSIRSSDTPQSNSARVGQPATEKAAGRNWWYVEADVGSALAVDSGRLRRPELVVDEEAIAFAHTFSGTQNGPVMGPTGKTVKIPGLQISKFRDGKMVERWDSSDQLGMLQQECRAHVLDPPRCGRPVLLQDACDLLFAGSARRLWRTWDPQFYVVEFMEYTSPAREQRAMCKKISQERVSGFVPLQIDRRDLNVPKRG